MQKAFTGHSGGSAHERAYRFSHARLFGSDYRHLLQIFFCVACLFLPFRLRFALARFWGAVLLAVLRWTCRLDYRVEGWENLPPGNHVALWKHSSSWETIAMAVIFPLQVWVLKRELTWIPFVGWGIRQLHAIAIDRKSGGSAVAQIQHTLGDKVRVVSAFQNVAAHKLRRLDADVQCDVLVCGDDVKARGIACELIKRMGLRGLEAGPISNSAAAEALTSLLIFFNRKYKVSGSGIRITGLEETANG